MNLTQLRSQCLSHQLPIMSEEVLAFIVELIHRHQLVSVLELGSCWGYSALVLASQSAISLVSIEKDFERHIQARYHVRAFGYENRINMVYDDALVYQPEHVFDLIIIDAAKAQYQAFVDRYEPFLKTGGFMVVDNTNFHGLVAEKEVQKSLKTMVNALKTFQKNIQLDPRFHFESHDIGDGLIVLQKIV